MYTVNGPGYMIAYVMNICVAPPILSSATTGEDTKQLGVIQHGACAADDVLMALKWHYSRPSSARTKASSVGYPF